MLFNRCSRKAQARELSLENQWLIMPKNARTGRHPCTSCHEFSRYTLDNGKYSVIQMNQHIQSVARLTLCCFITMWVSECIAHWSYSLRCMQLQSGIVSVWCARNDRVHGAERYTRRASYWNKHSSAWNINGRRACIYFSDPRIVHISVHAWDLKAFNRQGIMWFIHENVAHFYYET